MLSPLNDDDGVEAEGLTRPRYVCRTDNINRVRRRVLDLENDCTMELDRDVVLVHVHDLPSSSTAAVIAARIAIEIGTVARSVHADRPQR